MAHRKICKHCGGTEEAHHDYEPSMPEGCICDPRDWGDVVNDVCPAYRSGIDEYCSQCQHDEACHKGSNVKVSGLPQPEGD